MSDPARSYVKDETLVYTCGCDGQSFTLLLTGEVLCEGCNCINERVITQWIGDEPPEYADRVRN